MGWTIYLKCLTCGPDEIVDEVYPGEIDLDGGDAPKLVAWMVKHWGHHVTIDNYSEGLVELGKENARAASEEEGLGVDG